MIKYDIDSIKSLNFREGVRSRIQMYLGSDDIEGAYQSFKEIINNSTDEILAGFGKKIEVNLCTDTNTISVRDYGRGVPFGVREDGENVLVSVYTKSHTGGKFDDKAYANSSGLNGIGGSCVCLSSSFFNVTSYRNGKMATASFKAGVLQDYKEDITKQKDGTKVMFSPDPLVFKNGEINFKYEDICKQMRDISYLYKGTIFDVNLVSSKTGEILKQTHYKADNGIADLIRDHLKELNKKPIHSTILTRSIVVGTSELEIAFQWTHTHETSYTFTNGLRNPEGGTPLTGAKSSITRTMNGLLDETLSGDLARTGLVYVVNCKVTNPSFANQTKTKVNNPELRSMADKAFSDTIKEFAQLNPKEFKLVEEFLTKELKADRAAERARAAVMEQNTDIEKELKKKAILAGENFLDCRRHDENSELFLVEGKSAAGAIGNARDSDRIAVFGCRGKGLNVLKEANLEKILKNEEYRKIMIALGCGYGDKFRINKLRYGRIIIATDADVDGHSIACLLLTFFYRFYPELLRQGKIYRANFPLYQVTKGKQIYYAYTDEELEKLPKGELFRMNGLGEATTKIFKDTIFSEEGRYTQFTMEDGAEADYFFNMLMGDNIDDRRDYIFDNVNWGSSL